MALILHVADLLLDFVIVNRKNFVATHGHLIVVCQCTDGAALIVFQFGHDVSFVKLVLDLHHQRSDASYDSLLNIPIKHVEFHRVFEALLFVGHIKFDDETLPHIVNEEWEF